MQDSDSDPSIDYEDEVLMKTDEVKPTISPTDLDELRRKLEQMKAEESEEEMQHHVAMAELKSLSKEKEHQCTHEVNNLMAKRDEMRLQSQEAEKSREYDLLIESARHQTSIHEIKSQLKQVEEDIDFQRSSAKDILRQRQLAAEMEAKLYEKEMKKIQNDYDEKENNLKEIRASEDKKHKDTMIRKKSELESKYRELEEQLRKENQVKVETMDREHRKNIERLNAEAD